jgi:hypothetical protein
LTAPSRSANERGVGFRDLAAQYEGEFLRDMGRLGIAPPDVMTRVTEYIPEVCPIRVRACPVCVRVCPLCVPCVYVCVSLACPCLCCALRAHVPLRPWVSL